MDERERLGLTRRFDPGKTRLVPKGRDLYSIARIIEDHHIDALLMIGGWSAYEASFNMLSNRLNYPSFNIPMICLPASINNNLPGSEFSIGADTALNSIVEAVDKIKQSAGATRRCFVVEVMGHYCGYLALMSGMATGAERVYSHEEGIKLRDLQMDVEKLLSGFQSGKRLGLMIRSEYAIRSTRRISSVRYLRRKGSTFSTCAPPFSDTCSRAAIRPPSTVSRPHGSRACAWTTCWINARKRNLGAPSSAYKTVRSNSTICVTSTA